MGLYENWVLPRLTDLVLNTPKHEELRGCTTECLSGEVLELGFGSGLNVPHYPSEVTKIWAVEPSAVSFKRAEERIQQSDIPVEMAAPSGERIPLTTDSIDSVLSTWTLCTIPVTAERCTLILSVTDARARNSAPLHDLVTATPPNPTSLLSPY